MSNNIISILILIVVLGIAFKIFKFAIDKIIELALFLVLLYIGFKVFQGDMSILEIFKNFF